MKRVLTILIVGFFGGLGGAYTFRVISPTPLVINDSENSSNRSFVSNPTSIQDYQTTSKPLRSADDLPNDDFILASEASTRSVVYIKNISEYSRRSYFQWYFGGRCRPA